jgi:hypothetical protein
MAEGLFDIPFDVLRDYYKQGFLSGLSFGCLGGFILGCITASLLLRR